MKDAVPEWLWKATTPILNFFGSHPYLIVIVIAAICTNNALRVAFPEFTTRPQWARLAIGFTDPLCGNFWRIVVWLASKVGIKVGPDGYIPPPPPPPSDPPKSLDSADPLGTKP